MAATSEIKMGFWLGLGLVLAFMVIAMLQALTIRTIRAGRNG